MYLTSTPQNCQTHEKQDRLRNCRSQEEPRETGLVNAMWYAGWDSGTEGGNQVKTKESEINYILYLILGINTGSLIVTNTPHYYKMLILETL